MESGGIGTAAPDRSRASRIAAELEDFVRDRLRAERSQLADRSRPAFEARELLAAVRVLRGLNATADGERKRSLSLPDTDPPVQGSGVQTGLGEWARLHGVSVATARRRAVSGEIPGAVRVAGRWLVPAVDDLDGRRAM